jgi:hypothetical protein
MLQDPWAELEQKLRNSKAAQKSGLGSKKISVADSNEGADSQGTDSTVSVSSGSSQKN